MSVEPKMLLRYAIPGWYFSLNMLIALRILEVDVLSFTNITGELFSSVLLIVFGVPVGYILYQFYFTTTHKNHKFSTVDWNVFVISRINVKDRDYVSDRYAHMLRGIHELGVLRTTIIFSFVTTYTPAVIKVFRLSSYDSRFMFLLIYIVFTFIFLIVVRRNYIFKQDELQDFINKIQKRLKYENEKH